MKTAFRAGIASAVIASAACAVALPAQAGGLTHKSYGSTKDFGYVAPRASAGPCYFRGDVGFAGYQTPSVSWPVSNEVFNYTDADGDGFADGDLNANGVIDPGEVSYRYDGSAVANVEIDNTFFGEIGLGCGSGSHGLRAEAVLGLRGSQEIHGEPVIYQGTLIGQPTGVTPTPITDDPMHMDLRSYTLMGNLYYDLGQYHGFVPYVGVGLGVAYHKLSGVSFTENPALHNTIDGNSDLSFAWSLMAGFGYQITDNAVLDVGYRYSDLGEIKSGRVDDMGFANPAVRIDDLTSHEIKVGLRYHFGSSAPAPIAYAPMK